LKGSWDFVITIGQTSVAGAILELVLFWVLSAQVSQYCLLPLVGMFVGGQSVVLQPCFAFVYSSTLDVETPQIALEAKLEEQRNKRQKRN